MAEDAYARAKSALEAGETDRAREVTDQAFASDPEDPRVRELYAALHLAHAIRLSAQAREARRRDIMAREIPYDTEFQDSPRVTAAFDAAEAAIEDVLRMDPSHEKALMMKASLRFRRDRETGRPEALQILEAIAAAHPENRQAAYALKKIGRPCLQCSDSGFCPRCRGRGSRRFLGTERKCETCHGQGICLVCGVL